MDLSGQNLILRYGNVFTRCHDTPGIRVILSKGPKCRKKIPYAVLNVTIILIIGWRPMSKKLTLELELA